MCNIWAILPDNSIAWVILVADLSNTGTLSDISSPTGVAPVLQLHPTRRCNLACAHCYTSSSPQVSEQLGLEMLTACMQDAALLGYQQLAVSGGEPLLYPELPSLLSRARELGMLTSITTNGMLATSQRWAKICHLLDVVAVSIDGTPQEHDLMRGRQGAYAKTLANLSVIRDSGVGFGFIFTLTQHNVDSLEFVVKLAAQQGARSVQVHPLTLYGRAADTLPDARPDTLELLVAIAEATRLGEQLGVAVHVDAISLQQLHHYRHHLVPALPVRQVTEVAPILIVQADGAVVPLTHDVNQALWLGSLYDAPLGTLAQAWMLSGKANKLIDACEQTWHHLEERHQVGSMVAINSMPGSDNGNEVTPAAVYWYDEVAAISRQHALVRPVHQLHVVNF